MSSFLYDFWDAITAVGVILGIIVSLIEIMHVLKVGDTDNNTKPINQSNEHENNRKKKTSNRAKADSSDKNKEVDNQAKRNINKNNNSSKKLVKVNAYTIATNAAIKKMTPVQAQFQVHLHQAVGKQNSD